MEPPPIEAHVPCVLLVEDDADDRWFLARAFGRVGFRGRLFEAHDGEEALRWLAGDPPYADRARHPLPGYVLLDLNLPRRPGLQVLAWLRAQPALRDVRVAVLSSSDQPRDRARAAALGIDGYYVKPLEERALVEIVAEVLRRWRIAP